jgi:hypothetical protein
MTEEANSRGGRKRAKRMITGQKRRILFGPTLSLDWNKQFLDMASSPILVDKNIPVNTPNSGKKSGVVIV